MNMVKYSWKFPLIPFSPLGWSKMTSFCKIFIFIKFYVLWSRSFILDFLNHLGFRNKISVFLGHFWKFLLMSTLLVGASCNLLRKIEKRRNKSATISGAPVLVAADGHQQEFAHIFWIFEIVKKMKLLDQKCKIW